MSHHMSLLFVGILFLGCGPKINSVTKDINSETKMSHLKGLEGSYSLNSGTYYYGTSDVIKANIQDSKLFIEKLDDNDYGYYCTMDVITGQADKQGKTKILHTQQTGIFHRSDDGKYYDRLIYSPDVTKDTNISDDNTSESEHLTEIKEDDEVTIIPREDGIHMSMKLKLGEVKIVGDWYREDDANSSIFQTQYVKDARKGYLEDYKDIFLKKFKDLD
ncbi:MAG: hypothetical protein GXO60_08480 [Epsilonproteobacteria bacterium]|nr:hypothetical protein [Campylobacterota bacterium]